MKLRPDWDEYLHRARKREVDLAMGACPPGAFERGLELGAGDGFQSRLLLHWVNQMVSSDFFASRLRPADTDHIVYRQCDAEHVADTFPPESFDFIFSSNLLEHLEHLEDPTSTLRGIHTVLAEDGITIHVMPGPFWKLAQVLLYVPWEVVRVLETMTTRDGIQRIFRWVRFYRRQSEEGYDQERRSLNNERTERQKPSLLRLLLVPEPHGASPDNWSEMRAFRRDNWSRVLDNAGFDLIQVIDGPVVSGYGFGLDRLRAMLERLGFASLYIYVAKKKGAVSPYAQWFVGSQDDVSRRSAVGAI